MADKADDELEMTTVCHRPEGLEQLEAETNFTKQELQILYRGFKNVNQIFINKDVYQSSSTSNVLFATAKGSRFSSLICSNDSVSHRNVPVVW